MRPARRGLARFIRWVAWVPEGVSIGGQWLTVAMFDFADWIEGTR